MQGRVKWFNNQKGYGFIQGENSKQYFVHYKSIETDGFKTLSENDDVEFEPGENNKGLLAQNVRILNQNEKELKKQKN